MGITTATIYWAPYAKLRDKHIYILKYIYSKSLNNIPLQFLQEGNIFILWESDFFHKTLKSFDIEADELGGWWNWIMAFFFMDPKRNDDYRVTWSISYVSQKLAFKTASKGAPADFKHWQPSKGIFVVKVTSFSLFQKSSVYLFSELQRPFIFTEESRK